MRPKKKTTQRNRQQNGEPEKAQGIGDLCYELIAKGRTDAFILKTVKAKFPKAKTGPKSLAWYRNKASKK